MPAGATASRHRSGPAATAAVGVRSTEHRLPPKMTTTSWRTRGTRTGDSLHGRVDSVNVDKHCCASPAAAAGVPAPAVDTPTISPENSPCSGDTIHWQHCSFSPFIVEFLSVTAEHYRTAIASSYPLRYYYDKLLKASPLSRTKTPYTILLFQKQSAQAWLSRYSWNITTKLGYSHDRLYVMCAPQHAAIRHGWQ